MNKQVIKDLNKIKRFFSTHKWGKKCLAKKANGHTPCGVDDKGATCFCINGARIKLNIGQNSFSFMNQASLNKYGMFLTMFNDLPTTKKKDIIKFLDDCITQAKKG